MTVTKTDGNVVGEIASPAFSVNQNGGTSYNVILQNSGVNVITYEFQAFTGLAWVDLGALGTLTFTTLQPGQVVSVPIQSAWAQTQCLCNASGGSYISFAIQYFEQRASGARV